MPPLPDQLKRMRNHYRWLHHPPTYPTREQYGIEGVKFPRDQLGGAERMIELQIEEWLVDQTHLPEDIKIQLGPAMIRMVNVVVEQLYVEANVDRLKDVLERAANRHLGFDSDFLRFLGNYKRYKTHLSDWGHYENWKKNRNFKRAELERKHGYDCYLEDTEFLTAGGWKTFENISDIESVATLNPTTHELEFQVPTARVDYGYSGELIQIDSRYSNCVVTPNHKMFVSSIKNIRKPHIISWELVEAQSLMEQSSFFHYAKSSCHPNQVDYTDVNDIYLMLVGAYVSEGGIERLNKDGYPSNLIISQYIGGRLIPTLNKVRNSLKEKLGRRKTKGRPEYKYVLKSRQLVRRLFDECGHGAQDKKLPTWVHQLSKRQTWLLLKAMIDGDGHEEKTFFKYTTISKSLADAVQSLCVSSGICSKIVGPYGTLALYTSSPFYDVYIKKETDENFVLRRKPHISRVYVANRKVVCFTVPNSILITRRKGKIAIHGNSKHGMHLVRLMDMCEEILTKGVVLVRRPDLERLRAVRQGEWKYDDLIEWAEKKDKELEELMHKSHLPKSPNRKLINHVLTEETDKYLGGQYD